MTTSDIITLVTLVIAIVAILNEKNRKHLLLKLHLLDYLVFAIAFLLINYFTFYDGFFSLSIYIPQLYFESFGLANPKHWAYLIALSTLIYFFYKIWYSFYPNYKIEKIKAYYQSLIENNEIQFLIDLMEKYHVNDITKFISKSVFNRADLDEPYLRKAPTFKEKSKTFIANIVRNIFPHSYQNRASYASHVLRGVFNNPAFIVLASNQRPYIFAKIISAFKLEKRRFFPDDLGNSFFRELIKHKNFWLIKELKESQNHDYGQPDLFFEENKIVGSLLKDLSVAQAISIWLSFGEEAILEIQEEGLKKNSKLLEEYRDEQFLWEFRAYISITFFKIMIIEAIIKKYEGENFWPSYYWHMIRELLELLSKDEFDIDVNSNANKLVDTILANIFLWLEISNETNDENKYHDILGIFGPIVHEITDSNSIKNEFKIELLDRILNYYCALEENEQTENVRARIEALLLSPSPQITHDHQYYQLLNSAWNEFDKIPHRSGNGNGDDYDYFSRLKANIIKPLGYDPDHY